MAKRGIYSSDAPSAQVVQVDQAGYNKLAKLGENNPNRFNAAIGVTSGGTRMTEAQKAEAQKMLAASKQVNALISGRPMNSPIGAPAVGVNNIPPTIAKPATPPTTTPVTQAATKATTLPPTIAKPATTPTVAKVATTSTSSGGSIAGLSVPNTGAKISNETDKNTPTTSTVATTTGTSTDTTAVVKDSASQKAKTNTVAAASVHHGAKPETPVVNVDTKSSEIIAELKKQNQLLTINVEKRALKNLNLLILK